VLAYACMHHSKAMMMMVMMGVWSGILKAPAGCAAHVMHFLHASCFGNWDCVNMNIGSSTQHE